MQDDNSPVFKAAIALEKFKARKFSGLKPAGLASNLKEANPMKIPLEISLEIIQSRDDGNLLMDLQARVLGQSGRYLNADIDAEDGLMRPRIIASSDTLGLGRADRDAFATAAFDHMKRFFGSGPTGGTIKWARWVEVDLTPWLQQVLYRPTASRICRALLAHSTPQAAGIGRSFTESLEA